MCVRAWVSWLESRTVAVAVAASFAAVAIAEALSPPAPLLPGGDRRNICEGGRGGRNACPPVGDATMIQGDAAANRGDVFAWDGAGVAADALGAAVATACNTMDMLAPPLVYACTFPLCTVAADTGGVALGVDTLEPPSPPPLAGNIARSRAVADSTVLVLILAYVAEAFRRRATVPDASKVGSPDDSAGRSADSKAMPAYPFPFPAASSSPTPLTVAVALPCSSPAPTTPSAGGITSWYDTLSVSSIELILFQLFPFAVWVVSGVGKKKLIEKKFIDFEIRTQWARTRRLKMEKLETTTEVDC